MDTEIDTFTSHYSSKKSIKNRRAEPKIKLKKLRSVKLSRLPSLKSFKRRSVFQHDDIVEDILFTDASNSEQSTTTMQTPEQTLTSRCNLKLGMRKSSEGSDIKMKQTALRSLKFTDSETSTAGDNKSRDSQESPSANSASLSSMNKDISQLSSSDFASSSSSNDPSMMHLQNMSTMSTSRKTARKLIRKSSIKPVRISASMKAKKTILRKPRTPEHPDPNIDRGTCSSILKISKAANKHNLEGTKNICEELSTGKVCTYSYCSLHGNYKATETSLKRFSSMRRRRQKNLKSIRPESSTLARAKIPVNINETKGKVSKQDCFINETADTNTKISGVIQNMGSDFSVETCAKPKLQSKEIGIQTEDIDFSDDENPTQNPTSQISNISAEQSRIAVTSPVMDDSRMEFSHPGMKLDDALTEAMGTDQKGEPTLALSPGKEYKSSLPCDKVAPSDHCLLAPENLSTPAMLCLNTNDDVGICCGEVPVDGESRFTVESSSADSDSDDYCFGLTSTLRQKKNLRDVNKAPNKSESLNTEKSVGAKPSTLGVGSSSTSDPLDETVTRKVDKGTESELESRHRHLTLEGSEPDSIVNVAHTGLAIQEKKGLWNLIYQNMVSQLPTENETNLPLLREEDNERREKNINTVLGENSVMSSQRDSVADKSAGVDDEDAGLQKVELTQSDAIKLVQEAVNNILLSEVKDHTSNDRSTTSNVPVHHILQVNKENCLEPNVSSGIAVKESSADYSRSVEDGRMSNIMKDRPTRQLSKKWDRVKEIFLLKRFVKTLERIRKFGPRTPRHLPLELSPESENINLTHLSIEERRNAEEWMLDYALQLVISKLQPSQKRRVELLIKAYETVAVPPAESEGNKNTSAAPSSHTDLVRSCNDSIVKARGEMVETINIGTLSITSLQEEDRYCEVTETGRKSEPRFGKSGSRLYEHDVNASASHQEIPAEEKVILEVPEIITSNQNLEVHNPILELNNVNHPEVVGTNSTSEETASRTKRLISENSENLTETDMPVSSGPVSYCEGKTTAFEQINKKSESEILSTQEHPGSKKHAQKNIHSSNYVDDAQMEKKKQMKLWFMVYRRMLSGLSAEESTEKLLNDAEQEKQVDGYLGSGNDEHSQTMKSYEAEAVKLVEEAIDGIVLTDSEDHLSDNQSIASYEASDQEFHDDKESVADFLASASSGDRFRESDEVNLRRSTVSNAEATSLNYIKKSPQQEKPVSKLGSKLNQKTSSHWSKVRKLMRFIKALDKVQKFNPRPPRHLPLETEPEAETVNLKHQEIDDWKNSEEWMLDYAMQKAVAKLTPVRKKKVQMIVEAFETVMPTIKTEAH